MTNEEAKHELDMIIGDGNMEFVHHPIRTELFEVARTAIEKQMPAKMNLYEDKFYHCHCCGEALGYKWKRYPEEKEDYGWLKFCWNCGQSIDWSKE